MQQTSTWGEAHKGLMGRSVPPRFSNPDPVYDKKAVQLATLIETKDRPFLVNAIHFIWHTEFSIFYT